MIKFIALGAIAAALFGGQKVADAALQAESASAPVSAAKVSGVEYSLSKTKPGMLAAVSFTLGPASASTVFVRLSPNDAGRSCANRNGLVTCELGSGFAAEAVTQLDVTVAA